MLILTSNGLSCADLIARATPYLIGKRCALVTTASADFKEKDWHVPRLTEELMQCCAASVECFDFDEQTPGELLSCNAAMLIGGNPFYLLHSIRRNGFADALCTLSRSGTLIGVSAGSLVLTPSIAIIAQYTPEMNDAVGLEDFSGLALFDQEILPHYSKFLTRFALFEERAQQYEREHGTKLLRISDGEAIFFGAE